MSGFEPKPPYKTQQYVPSHSGSPNGNSCLPGCLVGCGIAFVVIMIVVAIGAYYITTRGHLIAAEIARTAMTKTIAEIDQIPDEEKEAINIQIDRVIDAYKRGEITIEEIGEAAEKIGRSPVIGIVMLLAIKAQYLDRSGLDVEEKLQAGRTIQRAWQAVVEEKISPKDLEPPFEMIADQKNEDGENEWVFKEEVSDDELREFFAELKRLPDNAGIPDQNYDASLGEEIKRIVDELLEGTGNDKGNGDENRGSF